MHFNILFYFLYFLDCQNQDVVDLSETSQEEIQVIPSEDALIDCVVQIKNGSTDNITVLWKYYSNDKTKIKLLSANRIRLTEDDRISVINNQGNKFIN